MGHNCLNCAVIDKVQLALKIGAVKVAVCVFIKLIVKNNEFPAFFSRNIHYSEGGEVYIDGFGLKFLGNKMPQSVYMWISPILTPMRTNNARHLGFCTYTIK